MATHAEGPEKADILGCRCRAQEHAHAPQGEHGLQPERVRAVQGRNVDDGLEDPGRQGRTAPWAAMYSGTRRQGKSPRSAKAMLTAGLRWAPESLLVKKDDREHHEGGRDDCGFG